VISFLILEKLHNFVFFFLKEGSKNCISFGSYKTRIRAPVYFLQSFRKIRHKLNTSNWSHSHNPLPEIFARKTNKAQPIIFWISYIVLRNIVHIFAKSLLSAYIFSWHYTLFNERFYFKLLITQLMVIWNCTASCIYRVENLHVFINQTLKSPRQVAFSTSKPCLPNSHTSLIFKF
jgi:hypothetical protein